MKKIHVDELARRIEDLLGFIDQDGGNPEYCYEQLHIDMAKAAAVVYDSCMNGQKFAKEQK